MAVPFYVPDEERENGSASQPQSTTTSATQTPLQSPTNEHLVQVFYEALSLYSASLVLRKFYFFFLIFSKLLNLYVSYTIISLINEAIIYRENYCACTMII